MSSHENKTPKIMLVVGEPSGDALGYQLIEALKELTGGGARIIGVGGELMRLAGKLVLPGADAIGKREEDGDAATGRPARQLVERRGI